MSELSFPHRRFNPLSGEWVLVSPHRTQRPWQGQTEAIPSANRPPHDPSCYLCPGTTRSGGQQNPAYTGTYVFDNDFAALLPDPLPEIPSAHELLQSEPVRGVCRVVCFSPRHDLTLSQMSVSEITGVVRTWKAQYVELSSLDFVRYVQIFENRGEMMGCSNPHPHGQIWSLSVIPNEIQKEQDSQQKYWKSHGKTLLSDYLEQELRLQQRIVTENDHFVALVPYWAIWPFETMILSKRNVASIDHFSSEEELGFADILKTLTAGYDRLFQVSFPYSMGLHQKPSDGEAHPEWHFHTHFHPPLLRSATVRKFMVGFELLAMPQRDITPESAAARLRETLKA